MHSALAFSLLEQWQWRNTETPKSTRNDQKDDSVPSMKSSQTNASAFAIHLHHQDAEANASDLPSVRRMVMVFIELVLGFYVLQSLQPFCNHCTTEG